MALDHTTAAMAPPRRMPPPPRMDRNSMADQRAQGRGIDGARSRKNDTGSSLTELLLQELRVENGNLRLLHVGSDRTLTVAPGRRPSLYAVLSGSMVVTTSGGAHACIGPGEIAIVFYGDGHRVGDGPHVERLQSPPATRRPSDRFEHGHHEGSAPGAVVLQAILDLGYFGTSAFSNRAAPDLFAMVGDRRREAAHLVSVFPFDGSALLKDLEGAGGQAMGLAFANLQLCHAIRQYSLSIRDGSFDNIRSPNMRRVSTVLREIRSHPERKWTVESMAAHVGLSRSAFAQVFHEIVGDAPMALLKRERMERAAKLLSRDTLSMHEVGRRVGYDIESSFARAFKRHWGVPPRAFARNGGEAQSG